MRRLAPALLVACVALAACGEDPVAPPAVGATAVPLDTASDTSPTADPSPTPSPDPSPTPSATPSPEPSPTPSPSPEPEPEPEPSPTPSPDPTPSPTPTREPFPRLPASDASTDFVEEGFTIYTGGGFPGQYRVGVTVGGTGGTVVSLDVVASGPSDLRHPRTSCLVIDGDDGVRRRAGVIADRIDRTDDGYEGRLVFVAVVSGRYTFQYSCRDDYLPVVLGTRTVPSIGVSDYAGPVGSPGDYYAVLFGVGGRRVTFHAVGRGDLIAPDGQCLVEPDGTEHLPVELDTTYSDRNDDTDAASFGDIAVFDVAPEAGWEWAWTCSGSYQPVLIDRVPVE